MVLYMVYTFVSARGRVIGIYRVGIIFSMMQLKYTSFGIVFHHIEYMAGKAGH